VKESGDEGVRERHHGDQIRRAHVRKNHGTGAREEGGRRRRYVIMIATERVGSISPSDA